jgi:ABC-type lipoprotein export system ATPase subunit
MADSIQFITKIEIFNLWDRYDLVWNLDRNVNIISGINGSGKSTILEMISSLIYGVNSIELRKLLESAIISFNNNSEIIYISGNHLLRDEDEHLNTIYHSKIEKAMERGFGIISIENGGYTSEYFHKKIQCNVISTFDKPLKQGSAPDENVKTELDKDIYFLQKEYLDYQLNIGKKAFEIVSHSNGANSMQEVLNIKKQQERFLEIIDTLFKDTDKKIDRTKNEIAFICGGKTLTPYQLSSGEKQILVILLTVLIQNNKPSILFMDEPEISLHFDWQKKLIQYIKELNPNVQIILATHSPAVVMEGWLDKVSEISDLITLDRKAK